MLRIESMQSTDNDLSQPPQKLSADEQLTASTDQLRGTILRSLAYPLTGAVSDIDTNLLTFPGIYQQGDRELRDEPRRHHLTTAYPQRKSFVRGQRVEVAVNIGGRETL